MKKDNRKTFFADFFSKKNRKEKNYEGRRLLVATQKLDQSSSYSFFLNWILELAKYFEQVTVICLEERIHNLPENIKVLSLGKEKGNGRAKRIRLFFKYIRQERQNYDSVLVHMNPEYVCLGGLWWRLWGKKVGLWYMHKAVNLKLRVATWLANVIFTGTKESFRLPSKKVKVIGHGVDVTAPRGMLDRQIFLNRNFIRFITVSRISAVKNILGLVEFASKFKQLGYNFELRIIGETKTEKDKEYRQLVEEKIAEHNLDEEVRLIGGMNNQAVRNELRQADVFIHVGNTGSLDKAWLEACAVGLPAFSSNDASVAILKRLGLRTLIYDQIDELVERIENLIDMNESQVDLMRQKLRQEVEENHNLEKLIEKIAVLYR